MMACVVAGSMGLLSGLWTASADEVRTGWRLLVAAAEAAARGDVSVSSEPRTAAMAERCARVEGGGLHPGGNRAGHWISAGAAAGCGASGRASRSR